MKNKNISFAINQIVLPNAEFIDFVNLAKLLDISAIEIRNDIANNLIKENNPQKIKNICQSRSIKIISINALQKFNIWTAKRSKEFITLCEYATAAGIEAIVLVPLNDGTQTDITDRKKNLKESLKEILPILQEYNLTGFIEPLGFISSSLRFKSEAVEAINELSSPLFKMVQDTFHHFLSGERIDFPSLTGLVHISGVKNTHIEISKLKDDHRSVIDKNDILNNIGQIKSLLKSGYKDFFSFEPFSSSILEKNYSYQASRKSFDFIQSNLN